MGQFPLEEYQDRMDRVQSELARRNIDILLLTSPDDMYWLTGYDSLGYYQFQAAITVRGRQQPLLFLHQIEESLARETAWTDELHFWRHAGSYRLDTAPGDPVGEAARLLKELGGDNKTIGVHKTGFYFPVAAFEQLTEELVGAQFVDASDLVPELRVVKSPREVEKIREAAWRADEGIAACVSAAKPGKTEFDIQRALHERFNEVGNEYPSVPPIILSGPRSVLAHQVATQRVMKEDEHVVIECTGVAARYQSNILRTVAIGRPKALVEEAVGLAIEAIQACTRLAGPGVPGEEIDLLSRKLMRKYEKYRLHRTAFGPEAAYPPVLMGRLSCAVGDRRVLQSGMVLSIEPNLFFYDYAPRDRFGVLVGNNVLITENGAETLHKFPLELVSVG